MGLFEELDFGVTYPTGTSIDTPDTLSYHSSSSEKFRALSGPVDTVGRFLGPRADSSSSQIGLFRLPAANAKLRACLSTSVSLRCFIFYLFILHFLPLIFPKGLQVPWHTLTRR